MSPRGASGDSLVDSDGNASEVPWSLEAHFNFGAGVGVRRRRFPLAEGCSPQRGAGAGGGSKGRGGWGPVSPPKHNGLQFHDGGEEYAIEEMDDRLRPRMLPSIDEATEQGQRLFDHPPPDDGGRRLAGAHPMPFAQVLADGGERSPRPSPSSSRKGKSINKEMEEMNWTVPCGKRLPFLQRYGYFTCDDFS